MNILKYFRFFIILVIFISACQNGKEEAKERPNFMIIMVDDMGYSDPGCYGGEIETPNVDKLAENGLRFTQFYNSARCCPSRAAMLTGVYQHQAGLAQNGQSLTQNVVTIGEVLQQYGYQTGMTGKWHLSRTEQLPDKEEQLLWLSHRKDSGRFAPLETYPSNRGFDEHWGVIWGVVDFFDPFSFVHNEKEIEEVPDDFYFTDFITDKSVELIDDFSKKDEPFFLYVAHAAPHWPLHALDEDIQKYEGRYDGGWDKLRKERYERQIEMELFDSEITPLAENESGIKWETYEHKEWEANHMETHAAMVDRVDQGIGKIIQKLKQTGELDNTLILFLSDNGASYERGYPPGFDRPGHKRNGEEIHYILDPSDTFHPGPQETWAYLGRAWAGAVNAPFRYWKKESYEGGMCTPFIVHWPSGLKTKQGSFTRQVGHIMDIMPTFLELANAEYPEIYDGNEITPFAGKSLVPVFNNETRPPHEILFWEHAGGKAAREGDWKIAALPRGEWELFDLSKDRTETTDLSEVYPEKQQELIRKWEEWYKNVNE